MNTNEIKVPTTTDEVRESFLDYFEKHGHKRVASSSLVPGNDPTLLFTNAGMVQFKDVFLGDEQRDYVRATSSQRCVRAGGKHNDLENVGYTARHHTFFEMLGNFSFGDYFKKEAIPFGWNFLTEVLRLPIERLYVTVYAEDDEAYNIWHHDIGLPAEKIIRIGDNKGKRYASDNFWAMGDTGPCGPCTEIFYDHGDHIEGGLPGTPEEDGDRFIEVWNIVFMQFNRSADGTMAPLPKPSVDTGMGLERIAAVMQHVNSNYEIDLFQKLIAAVAKRIGVEDLAQSSLRVIADHIRSCAFLISDGVMPSNEGRGYVLRRIIRRAIRHGNKLGANSHSGNTFFADLVTPLAELMGDAYRELRDKQTLIEKALQKEEAQFAETLEQGLKILEQGIASGDGKSIAGELAFKLYDTYGFPLDLTQDIARERSLTVDEKGYETCMQQQREKAKAASQFKAGGASKLDLTAVKTLNTPFSGYDNTRAEASIEALYAAGESVAALSSGDKGALVLSDTPFYAESGGQVGDRGRINTPSGVFEVEDTQKQGNTIIHFGRVVEGGLKTDEVANVEVAVAERSATARHHSATHLLHAALRIVLGEHVTQKGSYVDSERLRFDFSHDAAVSGDELKAISTMVNEQIRANTSVSTELMDMESAKNAGAMALFGEKYDDEVRVLSMGVERFSVELCGGTHVERTGDIGSFLIHSESGIASGVRRIEAFVGEAADAAIQQRLATLDAVAAGLKASPDSVLEKIRQTLSQQKQLEKKIEQLQQKMASAAGSDLLGQAVDAGGVKLLVAKVDSEAKGLRNMVDDLKQKLGSAVIVLAAVNADKISIVAGVSDDLVGKCKAGDIIKSLSAALGGKGGGKPQFAQGGGSDVGALGDSLEQAKSDLLSQLQA